MNPTDIAYCAGLIDGEGCIRIKKNKAYKCQGRATPSYNACIQVRMVEEAAIKFISETLGGWYYKEAKASGHRPLYCLQLTNVKAEVAIRLLLPFLRVKRQQADTVLALRDLQKNSASHRTKVIGYREFPNKYGTKRTVANLSFSDEYVAQCESLYQDSRRHNRVGDAAMA